MKAQKTKHFNTESYIDCHPAWGLNMLSASVIAPLSLVFCACFNGGWKRFTIVISVNKCDWIRPFISKGRKYLFTVTGESL